MSVAVSGRAACSVRCDHDETEALLAKPHTATMVMGGRETRGWLRVHAEGVKTKPPAERWVARGVAFARSLPPKR